MVAAASGTDELLSRFRERLTDAGVESHTATRDGLEAVLDRHAARPVVGCALPFEGYTLPDWVNRTPDRDALLEARTGITPAVLGIASLGSVAIVLTDAMEGPLAVFPDVHIAVLRRADVVPDIEAALDQLPRHFDAGNDDVVFVTGPSSTGDMGELVVGAHGPRRVIAVILE